MKTMMSSTAHGVAVFLAALTGMATGATYNDAASGDWTDPATWGVGSGYPQDGDAVFIDSGSTVSVPAASQAVFGHATTKSKLSSGTISVPSGASLLHTGAADCEVTAQVGSANGFRAFTGGGSFTNRGSFVIHRGNFTGGDAGFLFRNEGTLKATGAEHDPSPSITLNDAEVLENVGTIDKANVGYRGFHLAGSGEGVFRSLGGTIRNTGGGNFQVWQANEGSGVWSIRDTTFDADKGDIVLSGTFEALQGTSTGAKDLVLNGGSNGYRTTLRRGGTGPLVLDIGGNGLHVLENNQGWSSALDANGGVITNLTEIFIDRGTTRDGGLNLEGGAVVNASTIHVLDKRRLSVPVSGTATNAGTIVVDTSSFGGQSAIFVNNKLYNLGTIIKRGTDARGIDADGTGGQAQEFYQYGTLAVEAGRLTSGRLNKFECSPDARFAFTLSGAPNATSRLEFGGNENRTFTLQGYLDIIAEAGVEAGTYRLISFVNGGMVDAGLKLGTLPEAFDRSTLTVVAGANGYVDVMLVATPPAGTVVIVK